MAPEIWRQDIKSGRNTAMKLYVLKHSKTLRGFYASIICCVAGFKEEAIVDMLDNAGKYFNACLNENYVFSWNGDDDAEVIADMKLEFLGALKKELEADLFETDKPYIEVSS